MYFLSTSSALCVIALQLFHTKKNWFDDELSQTRLRTSVSFAFEERNFLDSETRERALSYYIIASAVRLVFFQSSGMYTLKFFTRLPSFFLSVHLIYLSQILEIFQRESHLLPSSSLCENIIQNLRLYMQMSLTSRSCYHVTNVIFFNAIRGGMFSVCAILNR